MVDGARPDFDKELSDVRQEILIKGALVVTALQDAITALKTKNEALATGVILKDIQIDEAQILIEDKAVELIALQQPVARDLRVLSTALKMTTDLERIGDHAKKIAKIAKAIGQQPLIKPLIDLPKAAEFAASMVEKVLLAYVNLDADLAREVISLDNRVDELCDVCKHDILMYMIQDSNNIAQGTKLTNIVARIERIGDHATNLAEWVFYLVTGEKIQKVEEMKND